MTEIIGYLAAFCTTYSFIPQAVKIYKTNNTDGISLKMYLIFVLGIFLWLVYGIMLQQYPTITANSITLILASFILIKIVKNRKKENKTNHKKL
jgi:MtN3 and saliva related transmembrane protein